MNEKELLAKAQDFLPEHKRPLLHFGGEEEDEEVNLEEGLAFYACRNGNVEMLDWLLNTCPVLLEAECVKSLLLCCVEEQQFPLVKCLASHAPEATTRALLGDFQILGIAAKKGHLDVLRYAREQSPHKLHFRLVLWSACALTNAVEGGHFDVVTFLLDTCGVGISSDAATAAILKGSEEIARYVLGKVPRESIAARTLVEATEFDGGKKLRQLADIFSQCPLQTWQKTAYQIAKKQNNVCALDTLVQCSPFGTKVLHTHVLQKQPIHVAAKNADISTLEYIWTTAAPEAALAFQSTTHKGRTPAHCVIQGLAKALQRRGKGYALEKVEMEITTKYLNALSFILERALDGVALLEVIDDKRSLPLHDAIWHIPRPSTVLLRVIKYIVERAPSGTKLLETKGGQWNYTPFHLAVAKKVKGIKVFKYILDNAPSGAAAVLDATCDYIHQQHHVLIDLVAHERLDLLRYIVATVPCGPQLLENARNTGNGKTAAHIATSREMRNTPEMRQFLLEHVPMGAAFFELPDRYGRKPIHDASLDAALFLITNYPRGIDLLREPLCGQGEEGTIGLHICRGCVGIFPTLELRQKLLSFFLATSNAAACFGIFQPGLPNDIQHWLVQQFALVECKAVKQVSSLLWSLNTGTTTTAHPPLPVIVAHIMMLQTNKVLLSR